MQLDAGHLQSDDLFHDTDPDSDDTWPEPPSDSDYNLQEYEDIPLTQFFKDENLPEEKELEDTTSANGVAPRAHIMHAF